MNQRRRLKEKLRRAEEAEARRRAEALVAQQSAELRRLEDERLKSAAVASIRACAVDRDRSAAVAAGLGYTRRKRLVEDEGYAHTKVTRSHAPVRGQAVASAKAGRKGVPADYRRNVFGELANRAAPVPGPYPPGKLPETVASLRRCLDTPVPAQNDYDPALSHIGGSVAQRKYLADREAAKSQKPDVAEWNDSPPERTRPKCHCSACLAGQVSA